jgi:hypothetical protein
MNHVALIALKKKQKNRLFLGISGCRNKAKIQILDWTWPDCS